MNGFVIIITSFFSLFTILVFIAVRLPKKRDSCEIGLIPEFEEICGGRINFINYTWPFLRHSIYKEFVVIRPIFGTYILPKTSLEDDGSNGIRYISPKYVGSDFRVWTFNKNRVIEILNGKA